MYACDSYIDTEIEFVSLDQIGIIDIMADDDRSMLLRKDFLQLIRDVDPSSLRCSLRLDYIHPALILLIILAVSVSIG